MADTLAEPFTQHLEFLGYKVDQPNASGWQMACHERRWNIFIGPHEIATRVFGQLVAGQSFGDEKELFFEELNRINDDAVVARFSAIRDEDGDIIVRVRARYSGLYDRCAFGAFMDAWHDDIDLLRRLPTLPSRPEAADEAEAGEGTDAPAEKPRVS